MIADKGSDIKIDLMREYKTVLEEVCTNDLYISEAIRLIKRLREIFQDLLKAQ